MAFPTDDTSIFKLLVDSVRDYAIFVIDPHGIVCSWNLGAQMLKGYTAAEILGKHISVFYSAEAIKTGWPDSELRKAAAEGRFEDEGWRYKKDGSRFWANVVITALRDPDGNLVGYSKITRDISARKAHEHELRESEERLRLLIEAVQDYAIYMLDPNGIVTSWNSGAQRIKGYSAREIIGQHFSRFYSADDIQADKPWKELNAARTIGRVDEEGWRIRASGERFWARIVVTPIYNATGALTGFAKVTQDLTQRKHAEDLEVAANRMNEFIAMLAHELRNPLAPIRTALAVMESRAPGDTIQVEMREIVKRQANHLKRIVDDLLDVNRIARGTFSIERRAIDVRDVVANGIEMALPNLEERRHAFEVSTPPQPVFVSGDLLRLNQVMANLLNNAARYTPPGGRVKVILSVEERDALISVHDSGRGIAAEDLDRIFGLFDQGNVTVESAGGLGIGLSLARRIVQLHGGTLTAFSEGKGRGSLFSVRIPCMRGDKAAIREPRAPILRAPPASKRARVLIVDDNTDAAETLRVLVESFGYEVKTAHNGSSALETTTTYPADVIFLDIGMPGMDGYEVARRMRAMEIESKAVIAAVTGWPAPADKSDVQRAGFDYHFTKPLTAEKLQTVLEAGERIVNTRGQPDA